MFIIFRIEIKKFCLKEIIWNYKVKYLKVQWKLFNQS